MSDRNRCIFCTGDRLMAPHEPVTVGSIVICGGCCGLQIVDAKGTEPFLRRPTIDERREAMRDPAVQNAVDEYNKLLFTKNKSGKAPRQAPVMRAYGPDHPKGRR